MTDDDDDDCLFFEGSEECRRALEEFFNGPEWRARMAEIFERAKLRLIEEGRWPVSFGPPEQ